MILGVVARDGHRDTPLAAQSLAPAMAALAQWPHDEVASFEGSAAAFAVLRRFADPSLAYGAPLPRSGTVTVVFDGRLDNRAEVIAGLKRPVAPDVPDEDLILAAWQSHGTALVDHLIGDYAISVHDAETGALHLMRDHMGVRPLYVLEADGKVAFASSLVPLLALPFCAHDWDLQYVADYLNVIKVAHDDTPYRAIRTVPPATVMSWDADERTSRKYWTLPQHDDFSDITDAEATAMFRKLFAQAVRDRCPPKGAVASELSGGLDSTSVALVASDHLSSNGRRLQAFSHALPDTAAARGIIAEDERPQIETVLAAAKDVDHQFLTEAEDNLLDTLRRSLRHHGGPPRSDLNDIVSTLPKALADQDIRVLLSGFGGDQLVTSKGAGWIDERLKDYAALRAVFRAEGWLKSHLKAAYLRLGLAGLRVRLKVASDNRKTFKSLATASLNEAHGYPGRAHDHPTRPLSGTVRAREHHVIHSPHVVYRLDDCAVGAGWSGFDYCYPMLDIRLMAFCHNLPTRLKRTPHIRRRMIREGMAGRLPDLVRLRDDKNGATVPTAMLNMVVSQPSLVAHLERAESSARLTALARVHHLTEAVKSLTPDGQFSDEGFQRALWRVLYLSLWDEGR